MSDSLRAMFDKLPTYWKMATLRCALYSMVALITTLTAGLQGHEHLSELTPVGKITLAGSCIVAFITRIITFLDNSMSMVKPKNLPDNTKTGQ